MNRILTPPEHDRRRRDAAASRTILPEDAHAFQTLVQQYRALDEFADDAQPHMHIGAVRKRRADIRSQLSVLVGFDPFEDEVSAK